MTIERLAFGLLVVVAILMGINVVGTSDRFGSATRSFDGINFELASVEHNAPDDEVLFGVRVMNSGPREVEILAFTFTMAANGHSVGGGQSRPEAVLGGTSDTVFPFRGVINDVRYMEGLNQSEPIEWLVRARVLVSVDERIDPVWQNFSFRTVTS